ncbi:MAG: CopG family transcriptional regulator [Caulobacter sp.]|nr:CopG family transcriptional regulator [Caulobacter sp.]
MPEDKPGVSETPAPDFDLFDEIDEAEEGRRIAEADADIAAGRVISHEAMMRWVRSWGTPDELPPPQCGE